MTPRQLNIGLLHHILDAGLILTGSGRNADEMANCLLSADYRSCWLYEDPSTSCSYSSNETNFTHVPESILASIHSSRNCTWLEGIITRNYSTQDVWQDLLPATVYNPNFTNCYGDQYMDYFNLSNIYDSEYSYDRDWLIPCGLSSLAESCYSSACRWNGAGNPDVAGVGVSPFFRGNVFPPPRVVFQEITVSDVDAGCIRV